LSPPPSPPLSPPPLFLSPPRHDVQDIQDVHAVSVSIIAVKINNISTPLKTFFIIIYLHTIVPFVLNFKDNQACL